MAQATGRRQPARWTALLLAVLTASWPSATRAQDMPAEPAVYPITIAVSDQTHQDANVLRVMVDGRTVLEHRAGSTGGWHEVRVDLPRGRHSVTATEQRGGTAASRELEVAGPLWITIMLFPRPDGWRIDVHDRPVGLL